MLFSRGTASFASPNIHHCSHGFHSAHTKEALRGNVAANNFYTATIVRKAVSTTTFACFRGAQFGNHCYRVKKIFTRSIRTSFFWKPIKLTKHNYIGPNEYFNQSAFYLYNSTKILEPP